MTKRAYSSDLSSPRVPSFFEWPVCRGVIRVDERVGTKLDVWDNGAMLLDFDEVKSSAMLVEAVFLDLAPFLTIVFLTFDDDVVGNTSNS